MGNHLATMRVPEAGIMIKNMDKEDGAKSKFRLIINFIHNDTSASYITLNRSILSLPGGIKNPLLEKRRNAKAAREAAAKASK